MGQRLPREHVRDQLEEGEGGRLPHASGREHPEQLLARNLVMWWIGRALVEDTTIGEVLDALHARSNRLLYLHLIGNVADQRQADLLRLVGDGKERLARGAVVHLDELDPARLEVSDSFSPLLTIPDPSPERPV